MAALGLYVHIPFCLQRCPYCAFAVVIGQTELYDRYVQAVCAELRQWQQRVGAGSLHTVFFGGGTPSAVAPSHLHAILTTADHTFGLTSKAEITLEANPATADMEKFRALRQLGFNRLSLGVQSFNDQDLKTLGRRHTAAEAVRAFRRARQAGFCNLNLDVIFSIPGSPRHHWEATIGKILALQPEHLSTYALTIEEGSRFAIRHRRGALQPVSEDDDAWAYAWAMQALTAAGYEHYEVSNFARPGWRSQHNWGYWQGVPYLGVGLSAHSFVQGTRSWNTSDIRAYIAAIEAGDSPCAGHERLDAANAWRERLWLQLRTCEGVSLCATERLRLQRSVTFQAMLEDGLLCLDDMRLRLTSRGFLVADAIAVSLADMLEDTIRDALPCEY